MAAMTSARAAAALSLVALLVAFGAEASAPGSNGRTNDDSIEGNGTAPSTGSGDGFGTTSVQSALNDYIASNGDNVYRGGHTGLFFRTDDGFTDKKVVPGTFLSNDIWNPTIAYPCGDPWCPNDGPDIGGNDDCGAGRDYDPYANPVLGWVVAEALGSIFPSIEDIQTDDWGYGVFYPTDSNSVDLRCKYLDQSSGYDCAGYWVPDEGTPIADDRQQGAGSYGYGNPALGEDQGGGAGCHAANPANGLDQCDVLTSSGSNLVGNSNCECNYDLKGSEGDWGDWLDDLVYGTPGEKECGYWSGNGGQTSPSYMMDLASCWVNNPRDLIQLQNTIYKRADEWSSATVPKADYSSGDIDQLRRYWGWNECPVPHDVIDDPKYWDSLVIKLPAGVDSLEGLDDLAQFQLECLLVNAWTGGSGAAAPDAFTPGSGHLVPGLDNVSNRPGSTVSLLKTMPDSVVDGMPRYSSTFFCEGGWDSPNNLFSIKFDGKDACYVDFGGNAQNLEDYTDKCATTSCTADFTA